MANDCQYKQQRNLQTYGERGKKKGEKTKVITNLFVSLCIERQLVNGAYFLDEMPLYELNIYIQNLNNFNREQWEMTRFLGYIIAQVNSTKKLTPSDIMSFPWEKDSTKIEEDKPTIQDKKYLQNKANEYAKLLNIND